MCSDTATSSRENEMYSFINDKDTTNIVNLQMNVEFNT
jgi:hypothetical protein